MQDKDSNSTVKKEAAKIVESVKEKASQFGELGNFKMPQKSSVKQRIAQFGGGIGDKKNSSKKRRSM